MGGGATERERTEVAVEASPDVVPVQAVDMLAPPQDQLLLESLGDRALPAPAEAGHPQGSPLLSHGGIALASRQVARLSCCVV